MEYLATNLANDHSERVIRVLWWSTDPHYAASHEGLLGWARLHYSLLHLLVEYLLLACQSVVVLYIWFSKYAVNIFESFERGLTL